MWKESDKELYDINIYFLKVLMSFEVVICHFGGNPADITPWLLPFGVMRHWAVPVFMILSFMLTYKHVCSRDNIWFRNRMKRLLICISLHSRYMISFWHHNGLVGLNQYLYKLLQGHTISYVHKCGFKQF